MNNQVKLIDGIRVKLIDQKEPVEIVSIDFRNKTLTWLFRGHLENTESFDDVEYCELPDTPPVPTIKPGDKVRHSDLGEVRVLDDPTLLVLRGDKQYEVSIRDLEVVE